MDYSHYQTQLTLIDAEVRALAQNLKLVADALLAKPFRVRVTNLPDRNDTVLPGERVIDAASVPTAQAIQDLLDRRDAAADGAWTTWLAIPEVDRRGLQPPVT